VALRDVLLTGPGHLSFSRSSYRRRQSPSSRRSDGIGLPLSSAYSKQARTTAITTSQSGGLLILPFRMADICDLPRWATRRRLAWLMPETCCRRSSLAQNRAKGPNAAPEFPCSIARLPPVSGSVRCSHLHSGVYPRLYGRTPHLSGGSTSRPRQFASSCL
jgi:hypothetical protein